MFKTDQQFIQTHGKLFKAVQSQGIFSDSKLFVDAVPEKDPKLILQKYEKESQDVEFSLKDFVESHFIFPQPKHVFGSASDINEYLRAAWNHLACDFPENPYSTSISLPRSHIVPGGRFRECYYWDSYFIALGLVVHDRIDLLEGMVENFAHLLDLYGHIPNGNRTYYLSRSQQPFFPHMLELLEKVGGDASIYFLQLEKEYEYWMSKERTVQVGEISLNRYYDDEDLPREEGYKEDLNLHLPGYRHIRAACESGWDFSSRWFKDEASLETIHTCNIIPVDLNCLLYHMEKTLAHFAQKRSNFHKEQFYRKKAEKRAEAIQALLWDQEKGFYFDFFIQEGVKSPCYTLAGLYPLFVQIASKDQADRTLQKIESSFLAKGGLRITLRNTDQQWDGSNGWAPLQWIGYLAAKQYKHLTLARSIAKRWTELNEKIFIQTHRFVEKYQVDTLSIEVQDGEYELQEGFGWSNGVYLMLKKELLEK